MKKKLLSIILTAILAAASTAMFTGCGNESTATPDTAIATSDTATTDEVSTTETVINETVPMDETDKAIVEAGLKVDKNGNVTDKNGNKIEADKNGNVKIKTDDGKTVTVSSSKVENANKAVAQNKSSSNKSNSTKNNNSSSKSYSSSSSSKTNSSSPANKTSSSNNNTSTKKPSNNNSSSTANKPNNSGSTSKPSSSSSQSSKTESSKVWHEAEYKYVNHPAETKQVWVVDQAAYSYEEPVYEEQWRAYCNGCGEDITNCLSSHQKQHALKGEVSNYHTEPKQIQVGTKTVNVPEEGHYETQVVKEAWTEKVLVREAGYY